MKRETLIEEDEGGEAGIDQEDKEERR